VIDFLLLAVAPCAVQAQAPIGEARFVQSFYDWYVPIALRDSKRPAWYVVLTDRATVLDSELVRALKADSAVRANAAEGVVGLDFDPFLNTQDPDDRYVVGKVTRQGKRSLVEVYSVRSGKRSDKAVLIAELTSQRGSWVFVNFHYPNIRTDLLNVLEVGKQVAFQTQPDSCLWETGRPVRITDRCVGPVPLDLTIAAIRRRFPNAFERTFNVEETSFLGIEIDIGSLSVLGTQFDFTLDPQKPATSWSVEGTDGTITDGVELPALWSQMKARVPGTVNVEAGEMGIQAQFCSLPGLSFLLLVASDSATALLYDRRDPNDIPASSKVV
jgi:hypothetical protein